MPTALTLRFYGEEQVDRMFADRQERVEDARPAWDAIADAFVAAEKRQFGSQGTFGGARWSPLSPSYAAWKASNYPGQPILRRDDDLFRSLTSRPLGVEVIEPQFMVIGSDVVYGGYHQRGDGYNKVRKPIELPESERRNFMKLLQKFIVTGEV